MRTVETDVFDGKCTAYVEGFCCEVTEYGHKIYPWKDPNVLAAYQEQFEADQATADGGGEAYRAELEAAYLEGVNSI